ncbi:MAG TPA: type II toxin-antitoxin system HicB family antitoxin [Nitrospirota bacterium]|nr:type II toxin-antitoxin system HicB family antitoxin [Nitrospirota bacterium]
MRILYPAKITYSKKDKSYLVEFPDLEGCLTEGSTIEEALKNAREALTGYLSSLFERGFKIPESSRRKDRNFYMIEPESEVATPIMLRKIRDGLKMNQMEAAKKLGISYQAYQRLENPNKCNPTIKTLERVAKVFQKQLLVEFV